MNSSDPWAYENLAQIESLKYLPPFIYGNYYAFIHWKDGTLNGHWCNTQTEEEYQEFSEYLQSQFPDIVKFRGDGYADSQTIVEALLLTDETQQVYLKMRWAVE